ncbi:MAG: YlxR family protein [Eubacterium sp.]|nr:YlxR family protein [Eubacterium sp.]
MSNKKVPMRRCVGCNTSKPKAELIRMSKYQDVVYIDVEGKANGRGVYLCKDEGCLKKAVKRKAFFRAFGEDLTDEQKETLLGEIKKYEED